MASVRQLQLPLRVVDVLDGYSIHPYTRTSYIPHSKFAEAYLDGEDNLLPTFDADIVKGVRDLRADLTALRAERGRGPLPMYASEFGFMTNDLTEQFRSAARDRWYNDRTQALALVRQALILLGEGFMMGMAFHARDYAKDTTSGIKALQFGLYYNLVDGIYENSGGWKYGKLAPRPAAPAYAAMTSVLEGYRPVAPWNGALEDEYGSGETRVYAFRRGYDVVLALWRPAGPGTVEGVADLLAGRFGIQQSRTARGARRLDWMGNGLPQDWPGPILVGAEPVYITGLLAPQAWLA
jgi:hypothetical protein